MAFYNGIRLPPSVVDARDWALNGNTITLGDDLVLDVPPPWDSTACYVASLGHKVLRLARTITCVVSHSTYVFPPRLVEEFVKGEPLV